MSSEPIIIDTNTGKAHGLSKCPRCGSADIIQQIGTGRLQCQYCRHVFDPPPVMAPPVLGAPPPMGAPVNVPPSFPGAAVKRGALETRYSGASDIDASASSQVTIKCQGCGAEIVIDTNECMATRCHWCRQYLSIEHQIPNGAVPDILLPFMLTREQARTAIDNFVKKRTFFANKKFKSEFNSDNVLGVYFPYLVIDAAAHSNFAGEAGHVARTYTVGSGDDKKTYYDIDIYRIGRDFDLAVSGLTIEASSDRRNVSTKENTNNIINTIMPFDIENAIAYNGHYLKGFTSERRDTNVDEIKVLADKQLRDISRFQASLTTKFYDSGVRWENEILNTKATSWRSAYLPVWVYSYFEAKPNKPGMLHYVAVNARTGETMGSVPVDKKRLFLISLIIELFAIPLGIFIVLLGLL